ncbi:MAG: isoprenylcysteine carboxylmethyltransferase family protein [Deltaproteobacteria bacterium]|nr:isoprenylcysteine carboxylmethyltransferase family protein [Deltaproteobacteria bacterium]
MRHSSVERLRRSMSWIAALVFLTIVAFSEVPPPSAALYKSLKILGYALIIGAALGRIWCNIYITGRKDKELCTDGPYSLCRNPLYLFSFMGITGVMCAIQNIPLLLASIPLFWVYYYFVITSEEERLRDLFGDRFRAYSDKTGRLLPRFGNYRSRTIIEIRPAAMARAVSDAGVFLWLIVLIEIREMVSVLHPDSSIGDMVMQFMLTIVRS